jgi:hypothetical protein
MTSLILCDDYPLILRGLADLVAAETDIEVVATCVEGEQALSAIRSLMPDRRQCASRSPMPRLRIRTTYFWNRARPTLVAVEPGVGSVKAIAPPARDVGDTRVNSGPKRSGNFCHL